MPICFIYGRDRLLGFNQALLVLSFRSVALLRSQGYSLSVSGSMFEALTSSEPSFAGGAFLSRHRQSHADRFSGGFRGAARVSAQGANLCGGEQRGSVRWLPAWCGVVQSSGASDSFHGGGLLPESLAAHLDLTRGSAPAPDASTSDTQRRSSAGRSPTARSTGDESRRLTSPSWSVYGPLGSHRRPVGGRLLPFVHSCAT